MRFAEKRRETRPGSTVLGLHFGHDAAVVVIRSGEIVAFTLCERVSRIKHRLGLDVDTIGATLKAAGIGPDDVDAVAVSSTQAVELLVDAPSRLIVRYCGEDEFDRPFAARFAGLSHEEIAATGERTLSHLLSGPDLSQTPVGQVFARMTPESLKEADVLARGVPWVDHFSFHESWREPVGLHGPFDSPCLSDELRHGFHAPVVVEIDGSRIPGYAVHHHFAHAACSYYQSGFRQAGILTHDGFSIGEARMHGRSFEEQACSPGMYFYAEDEAIYPLMPHTLNIGFLYQQVSTRLGLGRPDGAGKLMGLAAHGRPTFFDERFVGNHHDYQGRFTDVPDDWLRHCIDAGRRAGYDLEPYGDPARATAPINVDIAASTQVLLERIRLAATDSLRKLLVMLGRDTDNLCLSGGTALNCPSNSRIASAGSFARVFVEPMCDDGGLAIGAAFAVYHNVFGNPLPGDGPRSASPYLGPTYQEHEVDRALVEMADQIVIERCDDPAVRAAEDLAQDRLVAWFDGRSEAGPRALGHRSLLADPRPAGNWSRVNRVKRREQWRPLAPSVLAEHASDWFGSVPLPSPSMLFNAEVIAPGLDAVTHVDGTARIQTVDAANGDYYWLISRFHELTGVPVVLNTSLNRPGEPIVERPAEAVELFLRQDIDVLYIAGRRITRQR
ncbi:carbamoyltransferase C-terminal domain-containing protein [Streptomyces sp. NPDC002536]